MLYNYINYCSACATGIIILVAPVFVIILYLDLLIKCSILYSTCTIIVTFIYMYIHTLL